MAIFNDNNNVAIALTGNYCTIETLDPPVTIDLTDGGDCELIEQIGWHFVCDASIAGTINLQLKGSDLTYRTITIAPFPITLAASMVGQGKLEILCHGARFAVTRTAGSILYCELVGTVPNP